MKYTLKLTKIREIVDGQPVMSLCDYSDVVAGMKGMVTHKGINSIEVRWNRGDLAKLLPGELRMFAFGPTIKNETN
jgi:hypothetical protein